MQITVYKFGGASVKNAVAIRNMAAIVQHFNNKSLVIVVSALGKTTNALEEVVQTALRNPQEAHNKLKTINNQHIGIIKELWRGHDATATEKKVNAFFDDARKQVTDYTNEPYDFLYDQIVAAGELASTTIVADYLLMINMRCHWLDVRDIIVTDQSYREGIVDWKMTHKACNEKIRPLVKKHYMVLTQGFIASSANGHTTTLGREGSDYTGAILANCLNADKLIVWKDVIGVLNADPNWFKNTIKLPYFSYAEAVEMAYYGAKVIHPKTLKPLQNKNIPLYVKSFQHPEKEGTSICDRPPERISTPIIVQKENQTLLTFVTKDLSFLREKEIGLILTEFHHFHITFNLLQTGAVKLFTAINNETKTIELMKKKLADTFDIQEVTGLNLLTIRHYNEKALKAYTLNKEKIVEQKTKTNYQLLYREIEQVK